MFLLLNGQCALMALMLLSESQVAVNSQFWKDRVPRDRIYTTAPILLLSTLQFQSNMLVVYLECRFFFSQGITKEAYLDKEQEKASSYLKCLKCANHAESSHHIQPCFE